jgi:hypothetical protein
MKKIKEIKTAKKTSVKLSTEDVKKFEGTYSTIINLDTQLNDAKAKVRSLSGNIIQMQVDMYAQIAFLVEIQKEYNKAVKDSGVLKTTFEKKYGIDIGNKKFKLDLKTKLLEVRDEVDNKEVTINSEEYETDVVKVLNEAQKEKRELEKKEAK